MNAVDTRTADWHTERASGVGASDIGAILGLSTYASPWSLWAEKSGLLPAQEDTQRLRIGRRMEAVLAAEFHDLTGLWVAGEQTMCRHPEHHWQRATVDGFVVESEESSIADALGVVEFKTDSRFGWDEIPAAYRAQVLWQMHVTGTRNGWLCVMHAGFRVDVHEIAWDEADVDFMVERAAEFWQHVVVGTPPPVDGSGATRDAIAAVWPQHEPESVLEADQGLVEALARRAQLKAQVLTLDKQVGQLDAVIAAAIGTAETITLGGVPQWTYRAQERRTIDKTLLAEAAPTLDLAACERVSTYRVLRPVKPTSKE